ncbi:AAA family ATPase [Gordonia hankookensis]|uniref:AAA family ATPase n=1 Tax=Gordonia hankookensis TaxID=589403 RepID=A0ABR7WCN6_9ACTN|nr:AAA family ATPase [Gordonia hankookensis]MBD1320569.1 AAA family ATPase [Gordonia hankookensis]
MILRPKDLQIEDERTNQRRYRRELEQQDASRRKYDGPRNNVWTGTAAPATSSNGGGSIVGRVALTGVDQALGRSEYYIGERYAEFGGVAVFGWASDIAGTFFLGTTEHPLCDDVAVIRSFRSADCQIIDYADDVVRSGAVSFARPDDALKIPSPAQKRARSRPRRPGTSDDAAESQQTSGADHSATRQTRERRVPRLGASVRAERLLRERLAAPRKIGLASVLATLQPDQYDLVARPAMESTVIEGPPGTGKTIIATHRAAYMINAQPENSLDGDVLVVGPTDGYARHARGALRELTGSDTRITVESIPGLLRRIVNVKSLPTGDISTCWQDADVTLGRFVDSVISTQPQGRKSNRRRFTALEIYEMLRKNKNQASGRPITADPEWTSYLGRLPDWYRARRVRALLPLVAYVNWVVNREPPVGLRHIEHIVVDEAQDMTGLEWLLLNQINQTGAWTIIGDMNQRRSDHTYGSWSRVLEVAQCFAHPTIETLERGYRSTKPILDFANRLLSREQRTVSAVQIEGPAPVVEEVGPAEIGAAAINQAVRMVAAYRDGTVAVITNHGRPVIEHLRANGWSKSPQAGSHIWRRGSFGLTVLHHDAARGLEFDGVVVVEPASFPKNYGRNGPLYTALTRANRELVVVHAKALPRGLSRDADE